MKKILLPVLLALCTTQIWAQSSFSVTYPVSLPAGDLKDFVYKGSFRGIAVDYRYSIKSTMAVGVSAAWHSFYDERSADTYTVENISLHGKQYRYSDNVPMVATATYIMAPNEAFKPYATVGMGMMYTRRNTDMNIYRIKQEAWNFTLQPEIGVQIHSGELMGVVLSGKYTHGFQAGSELHEPQRLFSLHIGLCFF